MNLRQRLCRHDWRFFEMAYGGYQERCSKCGLIQHIPS